MLRVGCELVDLGFGESFAVGVGFESRFAEGDGGGWFGFFGGGGGGGGFAFWWHCVGRLWL